ncbi:MAG: AAA family ATPase [Clostridia bacterium]|nr:AAA family ATPase [Clostridia bacterium]
MTIKSIHISDFGKLSDVKITPSKKLNIVFAPNEAGKTTLLEFVKFVFYGTRQKKAKNDMSFKEKYMPWNGMPMSGSIEFESNGKNYYIYRSEGARNGSKTLNVQNADTGELYHGIDNPGEHFFSVDEKNFSNIFFAHDFSALFEPDDSISSVVYGKNEADSSYNRIRHNIEEELLELTSTKRGCSEFSLLKKESDAIKSEKISVDNEINHIDCKISDLLAETDKLCNQKKCIEYEYDLLKKEKCRSKILELTEMNIREHEILDKLKHKLDNLNDINNTQLNKGKNIRDVILKIVFMIISLIMALSGVFGDNHMFFVVGVICTIFSILLFAFKKKKIISSDDDLIHTLNMQIELCERKISEYDNEIKKVNEIIGDEELRSMSQSDETNLFTNNKIDDIINRIQKCEIDISVNKSRIQSLSDEKEGLILKRESLRERIDEINLQFENISRKQRVYNIAISVLDSAFSHLRDCYAPEISRKAFAIFNKVCKKEYSSLVANDKFEISLNYGEELKNIKSFSRSTKDAAGLSMRMAICDFISKDNPLPVFLDDVLASFDDDRCFDMMECIKNLSDDRQIFVCTCRMRETEICTECANVDIIRL